MWQAISKQTLVDEYVTKQQTIAEIAIKFNLGVGVIRQYIRHFKIKKRDDRHRRKKPPGQCKLCGSVTKKRRDYCSRKCSAVHRANRPVILKENLIELYVNKKIPTIDIAVGYGVSVQLIQKLLKEYKIPTKGNYIDFTNRKIGRLLCIEPIFPQIKNGKHVKWKCLCDCGNTHYVFSNTLSACKCLECKECSDKKRRSKEIIPKYTLSNMKQREKEISVSHEYLTSLFIKQHRKCALSNVDIHFAPTATLHCKKGTTASLDRIDSSKGYIVGNVQWVHKKVNIMKQDMSDEEFVGWCETLVKCSKHERSK